MDTGSLTCNTMLPPLGGSEQQNDLEAPRSGCQELDSQAAATSCSDSSVICISFPAVLENFFSMEMCPPQYLIKSGYPDYFTDNKLQPPSQLSHESTLSHIMHIY